MVCRSGKESGLEKHLKRGFWQGVWIYSTFSCTTEPCLHFKEGIKGHQLWPTIQNNPRSPILSLKTLNILHELALNNNKSPPHSNSPNHSAQFKGKMNRLKFRSSGSRANRFRAQAAKSKTWKMRCSLSRKTAQHGHQLERNESLISDTSHRAVAGNLVIRSQKLVMWKMPGIYLIRITCFMDYNSVAKLYEHFSMEKWKIFHQFFAFCFFFSYLPLYPQYNICMLAMMGQSWTWWGWNNGKREWKFKREMEFLKKVSRFKDSMWMNFQSGEKLVSNFRKISLQKCVF